MNSVTINMIYRAGQIVPLDREVLAGFKRNLKDETPLVVTFADATHRSEQAFRFFHVAVRRWAMFTNQSDESAKMELKILFGVRLDWEAFPALGITPPEWPGRFAEYHGKIYFAKSTLAYTRAEMKELTDRCINALMENGIDVSDLAGARA